MSWPVRVVRATGSTNADLLAAARAGDPGPRVLVARSQSAGRGRLGRSWVSPAGASLSMSLLWTPSPPQASWTWLPMVVGLGVLDALSRLGVDAARLKWPNDVVVPTGVAADGEEVASTDGTGGAWTGLAKLAGILVEVAPGPSGPVAVVGVGLNLLPPGPDLAGVSTALSALRPGGDTDLDTVAPVLAGSLERRLTAWQCSARAVAGTRQEYLRVCTTVGRSVRISTPGGVRGGRAVDVAPDGALVLQDGDDLVTVSAGDVEHVR